jgi:hypothetical protein
MPRMLDLAEIDDQIRAVRANLGDLVEQETARSGAHDDIQDDAQIEAQEQMLARLLGERKALEGYRDDAVRPAILPNTVAVSSPLPER